MLTPLTGKGAPFVLFFAATLVTSLVAGVGPALLCLAISLPLAAAVFVMPAGYSASQAAFQALLYGVDGLIIVYLTLLTTRRRQSLQDANQQLEAANEERAQSLARVRDTIELAPDAYFLADLDCAVHRREPGRLPAPRLFARRAGREDHLRHHPAQGRGAARSGQGRAAGAGKRDKVEWELKRKDGTLVPVEVSSNILPDGRWQAFIRDISERKRIEDVRQIFVSLLDNSSDFIGIADPEGKPIYLNAAGRRMIGLAPDFPVEQMQIQDCYPPELRDVRHRCHPQDDDRARRVVRRDGTSERAHAREDPGLGHPFHDS